MVALSLLIKIKIRVIFSYFCGKVCSIQNSLNNPSHKGSAVEAALVFGDGDEGVDQRILLNDVIRPLVVIGVLQFVSLLPKQSFPQSGLHHQQGVEELELSLGRPVPDKHEVQDPGSHLEPEIVKLALELRNCAGPGLR